MPATDLPDQLSGLQHNLAIERSRSGLADEDSGRLETFARQR